MGEEEKNRKQKKQGAGPQHSYLDQLVISYDLHGSYGGFILKLPHPQGDHIIYIIIIWGVSRSRQQSRCYIAAEHKAMLKIRHSQKCKKYQKAKSRELGEEKRQMFTGRH